MSAGQRARQRERERLTCEVLQVVAVEFALDGRHPHREHVLVLGRQELGEGRVVLPLRDRKWGTRTKKVTRMWGTRHKSPLAHNNLACKAL